MSITTIVGLLLLSGFVIPALIVILKQRTEKKKLEQFLSEFEKRENIQITEHETWRNKIIGMDAHSRKAIFIVRDKEHNDNLIIDLGNFSGCSVVRSIITSETDKNIQAVSAVRIRFASRDKAHPDQLMTLYNEEADQTLASELRTAENWSQIFNKIIRSQPRKAA
jgi:hypothetical protein